MFDASEPEGQLPCKQTGRSDMPQQLVSAFGWAVPWGSPVGWELFPDVWGHVALWSTEIPMFMPALVSEGNNPSHFSVLSPEALASTP